MKLIKQLKFFKDFEPWYHKILNDFDFKYKEDIHARDVLHEILKNAISSEEIEESLKKFKAQFSVKKDILIYGCGPSLETTINLIIEEKTKDFFLNFINIAADGASVLLRKKGIPINAIFTDLDGASQKEIKFSEFKIIHSHGDNIEKIKESEDIIKSEQNVIGTTQTNPEDTLLLNPGGFTDGDRIIFFIRHLLTKHNRLFLIGMDFGKTIGIYSKPLINL
ncbi:MAG: DUF115 domain-containing protein [Candidatus Lokiarchaeota archaeon]